MAEDLFRRFKAAKAPTAPDDDDSGMEYRSQAGVEKVREAELMVAIDHVPALPMVVRELMMRVGGENESIDAIEDLMKQDMVLAGRLLKLVNSPFYALAQPVASISQALSIIGFASVKSLVLAASAANLLAVDLACYGYQPMGLWRNSIATAAIARSIAQRSGVNADEAEEYFAAGLLRDVGILVLAPFVVKRSASLRRVSKGPTDILLLERELIGYDHCWVGAKLAERWNLPQVLRLCIASHHRIPVDIPPTQMRRLAAVRLAERLAYSAGVGVLPGHPFDAHVDGVLIHAAGLDSTLFEKLITQIPAIVKGAEIPLE